MTEGRNRQVESMYRVAMSNNDESWIESEISGVEILVYLCLWDG